MEKFLVGNDLVNALQGAKNKPIFIDNVDVKTLCRAPDAAVVEHVYANFVDHLSQECANLDARVAHAELSSGSKGVLVMITIPRGKFLRKHGFTLSNGAQYLFPEEAYWLSECGSLQVYDGGLPLSLEQLAYAVFKDSYTYACYHVYARLTRQNFVLRRREVPLPSACDYFSEGAPSASIDTPIDPSSSVNKSQEISECRGYEEKSDLLTIAPCNVDVIGVDELKQWISVRMKAPRAASEHNPAPLIFDVFDDRGGKFKKSESLKPEFVLVVSLLGSDMQFFPNGPFRRQFGIPRETAILLANVDQGDVYFQCVTSFSIQCIKRC